VAGDQRRTRLENLERLMVPAATTGGRTTADNRRPSRPPDRVSARWGQPYLP
jgi:hypothetical protein